MALASSSSFVQPVVIVLAIALVGRFLYGRRRVWQENKALIDRYGCQPCRSYLPYKWPLSLDILKKQWDALPEKRLLPLFSDYFDDLPPTFTVHFFGLTGYATTDPENVDAVNRTKFSDWSMGSRREGLLPFLGDGIFCQDGKEWKHSRELLRAQFSRTHYQEIRKFETHVETFIDKFKGDSGIVDLGPAFFLYTLSITTHLLFGEPIGSLGDEVQQEFMEAFDYASEVAAIRCRLADACFLYTPKKFTQACNKIKHFADHFVQKALTMQKEVGKEKAFDAYPFIIDLYSELQDREKVRDQLVNVLIAGRDSTASTLSWTFFLLVRHPHIMKKLQEEIAASLGTNPTFTNVDIKKLTYLKAVLSEVLRLYPQVPLNVRFTTRATVLPRGGGSDGKSPVMLPKGTGMATNIYHMHRRQDLFGEDSLTFRPERFLTGELKDIGPGYMAFHSGPRTCLGQDFAMIQASYLIIRILQEYPQMHLPEGDDVEVFGKEKQNWSILVSPANGCKVAL